MIEDVVDESFISLGERAVKADYWCWIDGMRAYRKSDGAYFRVVLCGDCYEDMDGTAEWANIDDGSEWIPDLEDAATLGCLKNIVRTIYKDKNMHSIYDIESGYWEIKTASGNTICCVPESKKVRLNGRCCVGGPCFQEAFGKSEIEAWINALEGKNE